MIEPGEADLEFWVVFFNAADYPGSFVVRRQITGACYYCGTHHVFHVLGPFWPWPTLEAARATIPDHLFRMPHHPSEDPVIVESWF